MYICVDMIEQTFEAEMDKDWDKAIYVTIFDVTFFILVTTVGLNIIFGIIVDTFSQLRDAKVMYPSSLRFIDPLKRGTTLIEINDCCQQAISVKVYSVIVCISITCISSNFLWKIIIITIVKEKFHAENW